MASSAPSGGKEIAMNPKWYLSHARGYIELGMIAEAAAELAHIPEVIRDASDFLELHALVLQEQQDWTALEKVAGKLCRRHPENPGWWVMYAYAVRRAESLESAEVILVEAVKTHPEEPTIIFNLGCYACQRGDLAAARARVEKAIALDERFREAAAIDPDLAPLRAP